MPSWQCPSCHQTVNAETKPIPGPLRLCEKCHDVPPAPTRSVQKTAKRRSGRAVPLHQVKKAIAKTKQKTTTKGKR